MAKKKKLIEFAASLNKETMFFKPTQEVESILVAMDREEADMIMDWEDVPDIEQTDSGEQPNKGE